MESSIVSGIVPEETPVISSDFSSRELISRHGVYVITKAKRYGKWFKLKSLDAEHASDRFYRELLRKEFEIGFPLEHPGICRTYDFIHEDKSGDCIVQEYVQGVRLDEWLPGAGKTARRRAVDQLIDALSYLHTSGIAHRDLKPANILITDNGSNVKVIDFGLSDADRFAILKQPAGTKGFSSPEQMDRSTGSPLPAGILGDIYSFGRVLSLFGLGGVYSHIAAKASSEDPSRRYASMEEIRSELHRRRKLPYLTGAVLTVLALFSAIIGFTVSYYTKATALKKDVAAYNQEFTAFNDSLEAFNARVARFAEEKAEYAETFEEWKNDMAKQELFNEVWTQMEKEADSYYGKVIEHLKSMSPFDPVENSKWTSDYFTRKPMYVFESEVTDRYFEKYPLDSRSEQQLRTMLTSRLDELHNDYRRLLQKKNDEWMAAQQNGN